MYIVLKWHNANAVHSHTWKKESVSAIHTFNNVFILSITHAVLIIVAPNMAVQQQTVSYLKKISKPSHVKWWATERI